MRDSARILVVAAHPDDEVLGCGATLCRRSKEGAQVHIAILGEGATSRGKRSDPGAKRQVAKLRKDARTAARRMGARGVRLYGLPDNRFDTVAMLDIVKIVEGEIEKVRPDVIFTHHGGDLNIDHTLVFRAVLTATRPGCGLHVPEVYSFEVPSATEWAFEKLGSSFCPNVFVDVTDTIEGKVQALLAYETETRSFPHPRSPETLRNLAAVRGSGAGMSAAEAFMLIRGLY
jgi:LmbE family N-acetylglucosaminyl deacetylase